MPRPQTPQILKRPKSKTSRVRLKNELPRRISRVPNSHRHTCSKTNHTPLRSSVAEIASDLLNANNPQNQPEGKTEVLMGDSTEVRALASRDMNMVHVLISPDNGQLLHLNVNADWPSCKTDTLISDKEPALTNAIEADHLQLCILHAIKYLLFTLWGEGMSKDDRAKVKAAVKEALFTLVNSTKKHLEDKDPR